MENKQPRILGIDAGGTMTDTIIIDQNGEFVIGKAQTTPEDESVGFGNSAYDALHYWKMTPEEGFPNIISGIYSGTSMLNRLLERKGQKVGLIVSRGMEDYLKLERGVQTHLGYSYSDKLHVVTHQHNEPLVPRSRIKGVGGRIDHQGDEAIPLYDTDVKTAVTQLMDAGVDCICVNLLFSYKNALHERRVKEIAESIMRERNRQIPVYLSSELCPRRLDFPRLNTLMIEAYAAEPGRKQLNNVAEKARRYGSRFDLRIMASFGGTITISSRQLGQTLISGPIGGVVGAKYITQMIGTNHMVCTDIGGTSFDVSLITNGEYHIKNDPDIAHFKLNLPMIQIESIGAGTGSFVRVNPVSKRLEFGPDSAGYRIGMSNPDSGLDTVSITDCDVVLGWINPDYFLGGEVKLDKKRATEAVKLQIADPLGLGVEEAASGVIEIFEDVLKREIQAKVLGRGYEPVDFDLLSYGGGGPLHVGGYTEGLHFQDILVPSWAAGFSAFGCACADFAYRYDRQVDIPIAPGAGDQDKMKVGNLINRVWDELSNRVVMEFEKNEISKNRVRFKPCLRMQYLGQLSDIEIQSPVSYLSTPQHLDQIIDEFENAYGKIYARSARSPELGFFITLAIMTGVVDVEKPTLPLEPLSDHRPPDDSRKQDRSAFWRGEWITAKIFEMDLLKAGNIIEGLAIIEAPSTTFVIPPGRVAVFDKNRIFHLKNI